MALLIYIIVNFTINKTHRLLNSRFHGSYSLGSYYVTLAPVSVRGLFYLPQLLAIVNNSKL